MRSFDNLLMMLRRASPAAFLPIIEVSSARSRESIGVPVWQLDPAILGVLSFFALVQLAVVLEEPQVRDLRHQYPSHSFSLPSSFLDAGRTSG